MEGGGAAVPENKLGFKVLIPNRIYVQHKRAIHLFFYFIFFHSFTQHSALHTHTHTHTHTNKDWINM